MRAFCKNALKHLLFNTLPIVRRHNRAGVLLTFDDGPHPKRTPAVLDRLRAYDAQAIFFAIGQQASLYPEVVRRTLDEGHLIGNHTATHYDGSAWNLLAYQRDAQDCQDALERITGTPPTLFRAPRGRLTPASLLTPQLLGLRTVFWSVDPRDYLLADPQAAQTAGQQLAATVRTGDIVLLHDPLPLILPLLDALLPGLAERGCDLRSGAEAFRVTAAPTAASRSLPPLRVSC